VSDLQPVSITVGRAPSGPRPRIVENSLSAARRRITLTTRRPAGVHHGLGSQHR
jgi:hypothetical protein